MTNHVHILAVPKTEKSLELTIAAAHSQYAVIFNGLHDRTGHLWRYRYYSCPLDQSALPDVLRYVEMNPVRAGLCREAWEWPWSSARAHVESWRYDPVLTADWAEWFRGWDDAEWKYWLAAGGDVNASAAIRQATNKGCPYGPAEFIERLEFQTGRRLRPVGPGRPKKMVSDTISVGNGV
jgi:putative transposase